MALREQLAADLKAAMKSGDTQSVSLLRMVISAVNNKEIEKKMKGVAGELTDEDVLSVLMTEAKKRKDSIDAFTKGGRQDLADKEKKELEVMQKYLPKQMSREEVDKIVEATVKKVGSKEIGPVMKAVMAELRGKADSGLVSQLVKEKLGS